MIDGEGTICGFDHDRADDGSHRSGVHIAITNTNGALLDEAARIWPTSRSEHQRPSAGHLGTMTSWRWLIHGIENKMAVLRDLYPYLIAKRRQAVVAYSLLLLMADAKRLGHSPQKDAVLAKRKVLTALLSDLNHQRPVVMPDWLTEPPLLCEPGFYLRQDIIWSKKNCMPESVTDRCTKSHEYIFLLAKSERYYFDAAAIAEPSVTGDPRKPYAPGQVDDRGDGHDRGGGTIRESVKRGGFNGKTNVLEGREAFRAIQDTRNKRSVWTVASQPFAEAHFATFPPALIEPCILAGCPSGGTVLDPFMGSGTVAQVAQDLGRQWTGIELNPLYVQMVQKRSAQAGIVFESA
jgi:hypothetical protein